MNIVNRFLLLWNIRLQKKEWFSGHFFNIMIPPRIIWLIRIDKIKTSSIYSEEVLSEIPKLGMSKKIVEVFRIRSRIWGHWKCWFDRYWFDDFMLLCHIMIMTFLAINSGIVREKFGNHSSPSSVWNFCWHWQQSFTGCQHY